MRWKRCIAVAVSLFGWNSCIAGIAVSLELLYCLNCCIAGMDLGRNRCHDEPPKADSLTRSERTSKPHCRINGAKPALTRAATARPDR
jgi:hypothetical protein